MVVLGTELSRRRMGGIVTRLTTRRPRGIKPWVVRPRGSCLLLFLLTCAAACQGQISREYQLKAAFLFHFAQFADWPTNTFEGLPGPFTNAPATDSGHSAGSTNQAIFVTNATPAHTNEPLVIGVLGVDPFGTTLDQIVRGERVGGRRLVVERYRYVEEADACHILFIARSEARRMNSILVRLQGRPVLTVTDIEGAAARGVMIRMFTENNRIRLRIDLDPVSRSGLTLSSKLLRAADLVSSESRP